MNPFVEYASYYDLFYRDKDYESEAAFIKEVINKYNPDTKSILDLGCGTGRHAILLAGEGYELTGIDSSEEMLEQARINLSVLPDEHRKQIEFQSGNITGLMLDKKYDCIYSLFHVISYQTSNEAVHGTFESVKNHLNKNGIFIFDVWYGPGVLSQKPQNRSRLYHEQQSVIQRDAIPTLIPDENVVKIQYTINIKSEDKKITENHFMRYFFKPEIYSYLKQYDIKVISVFDGFTDREPDENTWSATFIAKKNV